MSVHDLLSKLWAHRSAVEKTPVFMGLPVTLLNDVSLWGEEINLEEGDSLMGANGQFMEDYYRDYHIVMEGELSIEHQDITVKASPHEMIGPVLTWDAAIDRPPIVKAETRTKLLCLPSHLIPRTAQDSPYVLQRIEAIRAARIERERESQE